MIKHVAGRPRLFENQLNETIKKARQTIAEANKQIASFKEAILEKQQEILFMKFIDAADLQDRSINTFPDEFLEPLGFKAADVHPTTWRKLSIERGLNYRFSRNDRISVSGWDNERLGKIATATAITVYVGMNRREYARLVYPSRICQIGVFRV